MPHTIQNLLKSISTAPPRSAGPLCVVPLLGSRAGSGTAASPAPRAWMPEHEGLQVTERNDEARLEELTLFNGTRDSVFLMEGELLAGGYQDRMVTSSMVVPERSASMLPTACAEEGRFEGNEPALSSAGMVASPRFRRRLRLRLFGGSQGPLPDRRQEAVWQEIEGDRVALELESPGISLVQLRQATRENCAQLAARVPRAEGECGWLIFVDGRFAGVDLINDDALRSSYRAPLLQAAAYDGVLEGLRRGPVAVENINRRSPAVPSFWKHVVDETHEAMVVEESVGDAVRLRFETPGLAGTALLRQGALVHLSLFPAIYPEDLATVN